MQNNNNDVSFLNLPAGFYDSLYEKTKLKNQLENNLRKLFSLNKFKEIEPSSVEYFHNFSKYDNALKEEDLFKFTNNNSSLLTLRSDFTPQIARIVSTKLKTEVKPLKISYFGNVYKNTPNKISELSQAGIEFIGMDSINVDCELIILAIKSLKSLSLKNFQINISSSSFYNSLKNEKLNVSEKNHINESFGDINIINEIYKSLKTAPAKKSLKRILDTYKMLTKKGYDKYVLIDLSKKPDSLYSTDIFFKAYVSGIGYEVLNGTRYNNLYKDLDKNTPAIGFTISLSLIIDFLLSKNTLNDDLKTLKIALAKGRVSNIAISKLKEAGYNFTAYNEKSRELIFKDKKNNIEYFFVKPTDVPTYVEMGIVDLGILGKDSILEEDKNVSELLDLKFSKCKIVLAGPKKIKNSYKNLLVKRIATKYPNITKKYFKNEEIDIVKLNGSIELAPLSGLSDLIVDLVETGTTLSENGLCVFETIDHLSARLIVNKVSRRLKYKIINKFIKRINGVL